MSHSNRIRPAVSVVVPLFNEEQAVAPLVTRLLRVLRSTGERFEIVLVDDGSTDGTWERIRAAHGREPAVKGVSLLRNFGHQSALLAGLTHASGQAVVTMDGDLQHPPETIPELLRRWREGFQLVETRRRDAAGTPLLKRLTSRWFYRVFSALSGLRLEPGSSDFRLMDRRVLRVVLQMADADVFLRGIVHWIGCPVSTVTYQAAPRVSGRTKFSAAKMLRLSSAAIVSFSTVPLKLGIWLGLLTSGLAAVEIVYILAMYLSGNTVPGWASVLTLMSFMFGVLFVLLGILGTYLASIHASLRKRPRYLVEDRAGLSTTPQHEETSPELALVV